MKTRKYYAVEVIDSTCNVLGHESGIYGKGDYSWVTERLNGGIDVEWNLTEQEANDIKADFERVIKEQHLEWASVHVGCLEVPDVDTMDELADYYNESDDITMLDKLIEKNGWVNDCHETFGICYNDKEKVVVDDNGKAIVVPA